MKKINELDLPVKKPSEAELEESYLALEKRFFPAVDRLWERFLELKSNNRLYED